MELPAHKFFVENIRKCVESSNGFWDIYIDKTVIRTKLVWIQGHVKQLVDDDTLIISDGTGLMKITSCTALPGDKSWLEKDVYCSVVGFIMKVSPIPEMKAFRLINENENPISPYMWKLEVSDMKQFLVENQSYS